MISPGQQAEYAARPLRWGIAGTGGIAATFATDLPLLNDGAVVAAGSRRKSTADTFADRFDISGRYGSYADLVADPQVDAVHVATPHSIHREVAMLAIEAGKHVLVEKAFTINAVEAQELVDAARARGVFLMEAMWTRFLPHSVDLRGVLESGILGDIRLVLAERGRWFAEDPDFRLFAPDLGGGALLDLGVYPLSFASMVFGAPARITAVGELGFTGVDAQTAAVLQYAGGRLAVISTTLQGSTATRASIIGTDARIDVDADAYGPTSFSVVTRDGVVTRHEHQRVGHGLRYEAAEVARCLRAGQLESPVMPLDETVQIMATMDEIRRQIGLVYPQER